METENLGGAPRACANCGTMFSANADICPACGQHNNPMTNDDTITHDALTQPATPSYAASAWETAPQTSAARSGIGALGNGGQIAPAPKVTSQRRRTVLVATSALVLVVLLGTASFWLYNAFAARADTASARLVPANTAVYVSFDLVAASNNSHNFNLNDLAAKSSANLMKDTGLNWQTDIQPWIGQYATLAVLPETSGANASKLPVGVVGLLQSRDDKASGAAIAKAIANEKSHGKTVTQSSYNGFTLYAGSNGNGIVTSGSGWVVFASDATAAHAVVDRIKGNGDSLQGSQAFTDATSGLPNGRFGTIYVNLRQGLGAIIPSVVPSGAASAAIPFLDTYPAGAGYLQWTDAGLQSQLTFAAAQSASIPQVGGDTTGLAAFVPATATSYVGIANVGTLASTAMREILPSALSGQDLLQGVLGVSASTPGLQQPGALATIGTGKNANELFLLHASDAASANSLLATIAKKQSWTLQTKTVNGQSETEIYGKATVGTKSPNGTVTPAAKAQLLGVATFSHGTLALAQNATDLGAFLATASGSQASLAQAQDFAAFKQQAGSSSATAFYAVQGAASSGTTSTPTSTLPVKAIYSTSTWTNSQLQFTTNIILAS